jgi:hypothetical protein
MTDLQALRVAATAVVKDLMNVEQMRHHLRDNGMDKGTHEKALAERAAELSEANDRLQVIIASKFMEAAGLEKRS